MSLHERLKKNEQLLMRGFQREIPSARTEEHDQQFLKLKALCQQRATEDESFYRPDSEESLQELRPKVEQLIQDVAASMRYPLSSVEVAKLAQELLDDIYGLGPIEPLLADPTVSDILINGPKQVFVERNGKLELTDVQFINHEHLRNKVDRILYYTGRRVDECSPLVDARLPDGSRVNVIIPPIAIDGISVSIRKFPEHHLRAKDLIALGALSQPMYQFLDHAVKAGMNILICGGTGSGKTTTLNMLSGLIPTDERIITIEDSAELRMQQEHVVRLETRAPNAEGEGEITQRDLLKNALRMRPDRIILGEVRGGEVLDMLQAMNTGHEGSMATIHANNPRDAISRLELMIHLSGVDIPDYSIKRQIASALDLIIHVERGRDGKRRMISITEVTGIEQDNVVLQEIFRFNPEKERQLMRPGAGFEPTGIHPVCGYKCEQLGVPLPSTLFQASGDNG